MSVEAKIKTIIQDQLGVSEEEVKPEASFIEDLGADFLILQNSLWQWKMHLTVRLKTKTLKRF